MSEYLLILPTAFLIPNYLKYRKIKMGQENVSGLQQRILVRSRVKISGDGDLEAICRRTLL